jgi:hypothetical protein
MSRIKPAIETFTNSGWEMPDLADIDARSREYDLFAHFPHPQGWAFTPHDSVLRLQNKQQDLLWKITIPGSERAKVMRHFDKFNLNEFTLFDSEEALLETLAVREIDLELSKRRKPENEL